MDKRTIRTHIIIPQKNLIIGNKIKTILKFKNTGKKDIRIYMIENEAFRAGQSTLFIIEKNTEKLMDMSPSPRPHGYIVTEKDFHLLKPGEEISFEQTIKIDEAKIKDPGEYILKWTYENDTVKWPGGIKTLDGLTKKLFGGGNIPDIYLGKIEKKANIIIEKSA